MQISGVDKRVMAMRLPHNLKTELDEESGFPRKEAFYRFAERTRAFSIIWRLKNGEQRISSWSNFVNAHDHPDLGGIILDFVDGRVTVTGRNLSELVFLIAENDVGLVWEQHTNDMAIDESEPYISKVTWEPR